MTNREFTSHCRIAPKTNFLLLLLFPAHFAHAHYSSRMIDRFLNWDDNGKPKSGKIKGHCQPPPPPPLRLITYTNNKLKMYIFQASSDSLYKLCKTFSFLFFCFLYFSPLKDFLNAYPSLMYSLLFKASELAWSPH